MLAAPSDLINRYRCVSGLLPVSKSQVSHRKISDRQLATTQVLIVDDTALQPIDHSVNVLSPHILGDGKGFKLNVLTLNEITNNIISVIPVLLP